MSPFEALLGYPPLFPEEEGDIAVPSVRAHLRHCRRLWRATQNVLRLTAERNSTVANRHRTSVPPYQVGQQFAEDFFLFQYDCAPLHTAREQPIFSSRAHVFQIDPATKRNWLPASKHAVTVSFFYDASRSVYRIISVGGTKAIINSTITPNMTFTKTSQKFGQWADSRANTVYGLGFSTEQQLQQFAEQFKEVKEAVRLAREKSQERFELANPALSIAAPQELSEERHSPPLLTVNGPGEEKLFRSKSAEVELTAEKERVKKMLSEGSVCEINLEAELFTLQDSNARLVAALQEANSTAEQWKKQLAEYQEETDRLREQVAELEAQLGHPAAGQPGKEELSRSLEELQALLRAKDQEIYHLQSKKTDVGELEKEREEAMQSLQDLERRNTELEDRVQRAEKTLASNREEQAHAEVEVQRIIEVLDIKIGDLNGLRDSLAKLINK
ncbi:homer protein homolog 3-like [Pholidichthys leucotaenia]